MTRAGTAPMATYPNSSTNLYLQVRKKQKLACEKIIPPIVFVIVSASNSSAVFAVNTWEREFGFRLIVSNQSRATQRETVLPLVEKEDVRGSYTGHDPYQPAHVARPWPQLPQHQPDDTHQFWACWPVILSTKLHIIHRLRSRDPPGRVGGSYEEVNGHPVTHVETLLHLPTQWQTEGGIRAHFYTLTAII